MNAMDSASFATVPRLIFRKGGDLLIHDGPGGGPAEPPVPWPATPDWTVTDSFVMRPQQLTAIRLAGVPDSAPDGFAWVHVRQGIAEGAAWASAACRALALLNWRARHRYCGSCGEMLAEHPVETARICPACSRVVYPDVSPAVIVRIEKEGRILLVRHVYRLTDVFACVAGHLEPGESAEDAVRREVMEEVGLTLRNLRYIGSQHWPFPNQLMLAFVAEWAGGDICLQPEEIAEAQWFSPDALPRTPPPGSVAWRLIHGPF